MHYSYTARIQYTAYTLTALYTPPLQPNISCCAVSRLTRPSGNQCPRDTPSTLLCCLGPPLTAPPPLMPEAGPRPCCMPCRTSCVASSHRTSPRHFQYNTLAHDWRGRPPHLSCGTQSMTHGQHPVNQTVGKLFVERGSIAYVAPLARGGLRRRSLDRARRGAARRGAGESHSTSGVPFAGTSGHCVSGLAVWSCICI